MAREVEQKSLEICACVFLCSGYGFVMADFTHILKDDFTGR